MEYTGPRMVQLLQKDTHALTHTHTHFATAFAATTQLNKDMYEMNFKLHQRDTLLKLLN